ncbi:hypothetical protein K435DRAFT_963633 [Dendrothele bispora CBS 962.96]|uniref:RING-type E3 ubiquitin transferase n=1 Tax=Dendrothele bispora (strain CBS 962.96) TaxID=1314807 RepID=A0A4S8MFQ6_DENBC|nr:hypothetical protein K435DRAFT_963633 [Dendrothele bispora CBS 962.96]
MDDQGRDGETVVAQGPRQRSSLPSILFILLMLLLLTSHNGEEYLARHQYQEALETLTDRLGNFTAWRNGTTSNFTLPDRNPSITSLLDVLLPNNGTLNPHHSSYYPNVTGFIHGDTKLYNITPAALSNSSDSFSWKPLAEKLMQGVEMNMSKVLESMGDWNWSAPTRTSMSFIDEASSLSSNNSSPAAREKIAFIHGRIELANPDSEDLRLDFEGVHFQSNGTIYAFANPNGRAFDIRLLPSLVPENVVNETVSIIESKMETRITQLKEMIDAGVIEQNKSSDDQPVTNCSFTFYAQLNSVNIPEVFMEEYEQEVQTPTGIRTANPPRMSLKGVLLSTECGMLYELDNMEGLRSKTFFRKVITYAGTAAAAYLILLLLLSRQMERSYTPSGISRVSRWTFLVQSTIDSVSFASHITFAILADGRTSLGLIAPAFLTCLAFIYEAQFAMTVYQIQLPEQTAPTTTRRPPPATATPAPVATAERTDTLPTTYPPPAQAPTSMPAAINANATNTTPAPTPTQNPNPQSMTFWAFFWHHLRTDPQARMYLMLFVFLTCIVRIILSPTLSLLFVASTYSLIWLPQIWRSVKRGRSSGLKAEYVLGTTACRLYSVLYFLTCPRNVFEIEPRPWAYQLSAFVCLQAAVVVMQEYLGPTFFLPRHLSEMATVKTYDYHPPLPLPDPEAPEQSLGDCSICMDTIVVDPLLHQAERESRQEEKEKNGKGKGDHWDASGPTKRKSHGGMDILNAVQKGMGNAVTRKSYSLAPCHHLFHTECLERWLAIKNICPQCRRPLPPL